jgi:demethylmenaquinone methyltransferase/2-methoxy-6-polyprenyl-1,4-benzoquinol methylase
MTGAEANHELEALLAEQIAYYRAPAPEYRDDAMEELGVGVLASAERDLLAAIDAFAATGDVLELACGPGTWTERLLRHARSLTCVDASPEMLALAAERVSDERVRYLRADVFSWEPDRRYDAVFFGFWLSHVPLERFDSFWTTVARALATDGRVLFVDDAYRTGEELIEGHDSSTIGRRLRDGRPYRAVKVPHTPESLERRLADAGWSFTVRYVGSGPFFWGEGKPNTTVQNA